MAMRDVVTMGFGNGTFSPGVNKIPVRGYSFAISIVPVGVVAGMVATPGAYSGQISNPGANQGRVFFAGAQEGMVVGDG